MADPLKTINTRKTAQTERVPGRNDQVRNNAGGFGFAVTDWDRALRFLILGSTGGTLYVNEKTLTKQNADVIIRLAEKEGVKLVDLILQVSLAGRAPRQQPTLFALAICCASPDLETRKAATAAIQKVCRTATMLFEFVGYVKQFRGFGPSLKNAVAGWYEDKSLGDLAYQAVKYRQREGWTHGDLLRLSHPKTVDADRNALYRWILSGTLGDDLAIRSDAAARMILGYAEAQKTTDVKQWVELASFLPWEALPDAAINEPAVLEALLPNMGLTALIRQLPRLTRAGVLSTLGGGNGATRFIADTITDSEKLKKSRIHPLTVLNALVTYQSGHSFRGSSTWTPVTQVVDALDASFYEAFGNVEPAGKRTMLALDVSGSMNATFMDSPLTCMQAATAMAMVTAAVEPAHFITVFDTGLKSVDMSTRRRLDDNIRALPRNYGGTDCALPTSRAASLGWEVDTFVVYTDSETYAGSMHPYQSLRLYREKTGIPAKLVVVGMTSTGFTIADPSDAGMMDVVGFDTATPNLISSFSKGDL